MWGRSERMRGEMTRKLIVCGLLWLAIPLAAVAQHWPYYPPGAPYPMSRPPMPGRYYGQPPGYGYYAPGQWTRPRPEPYGGYGWRYGRRGTMQGGWRYGDF